MTTLEMFFSSEKSQAVQIGSDDTFGHLDRFNATNLAAPTEWSLPELQFLIQES